MTSTYTLATMEVPKVFFDFVRSKLKDAGYDHAIDGDLLDMTHIGLVSGDDAFHLNKDGSAAVGDYAFQPMRDCPVGVKVQLLTKDKVAVHGIISNSTRHHYLGFTPLPRIPESLLVEAFLNEEA
jgi:uncharacterized membrane protein